jgi:hypothetical protein
VFGFFKETSVCAHAPWILGILWNILLLSSNLGPVARLSADALPPFLAHLPT